MPYKESLSYDNNTLHPSKSTASLVLRCPLLVTLLQHQSVCKAPVSLSPLEQDPEIFKNILFFLLFFCIISTTSHLYLQNLNYRLLAGYNVHV